MERRDTEIQRDPEMVREPVVTARPVESSTEVSTINPGRRAMDFVYLVFGVIDGLLFIRLVLKLLGANALVPFAQLVYNVTNFFLAPFKNLLPAIGNNESVLELSVIVAILVYALIAWVLARLMAIIFFRSVTYSRRGFL